MVGVGEVEFCEPPVDKSRAALNKALSIYYDSALNNYCSCTGWIAQPAVSFSAPFPFKPNLVPNHTMADPPTSQNSTSRLLADLDDRRREIRTRIEELELVTSADPSLQRSEKIHILKDEYNELVRREEGMAIQQLSDPLQALPPELWPTFLPRNVTELLNLTLVSTKWRGTLLSIPILWTNIELNGTRDDYLCQAVLGLACSAPLEISLSINLPMEIWNEVAPIFVEERNRITYLDITFPQNIENMTDGLKILSDFGDLQNLTSLVLPSSYLLPPLLSTESEFVGSLDYFPADETLLARMPKLSTFYSSKLSIEQIRLPSVRNFENVEIRILRDDMVMALQQLPHLKFLNLVEEKSPYKIGELIHSSLNRSLSTVEHFYYHGLSLSRALPCIGYNLRMLDAKYISMIHLPDVLVQLPSFPNLSDLSLSIDHTAGDSFNDHRMHPLQLLTIKSLRLAFTSSYSHTLDWEAGKTSRKQALDQLFHSFIAIMPAIEELQIMGETFGTTALNYIQSLCKLETITFATDLAGYDGYPLVLSTDRLESVSWYGNIPPDGIIDFFKSSTLQKLSFTPNAPVMSYSYPHFEPNSVIFPRCRATFNILSSLKALTLAIDYRLVLELNSFPKLKTLELTGHPSAVLAGDLFEEIALQPDTCPTLEEICLRGLYVEWDLLILMLERRNLATKPETSRIKSIKLDCEPGYRLLRPITELLGGKYPHRDPLKEYSTIAVGKVIWDSTL